jgi:hypothetical protein
MRYRAFLAFYRGLTQSDPPPPPAVQVKKPSPDELGGDFGHEMNSPSVVERVT